MDRFYCPPAALPEHLYRVQYPSSRTILSGNGLEARDTNFFYSTDEIRDFRQSIINQLTWGHRGDQPYITCFSDEKHAQNWALKEPWTKGEGQNWTLLTINTRKMSGTAVFKLSELVKSFSLSLPDGARQHVQGAYLCLHSVPTSAIIRQASVEEVEEEVHDRKYQENGHWLDEYSGSDREAVENNLNDDLIKMIEGTWD